MPPTHDKAAGLINSGLAYLSLRPSLVDAKDALLLAAHQRFSAAGAVADEIGDRRLASYAWGNLGKLYEEENRYQDALQLTRRATFAAQQVNAPESLYRWEWQTGRLLPELRIRRRCHRRLPARGADIAIHPSRTVGELWIAAIIFS